MSTCDCSLCASPSQTEAIESRHVCGSGSQMKLNRKLEYLSVWQPASIITLLSIPGGKAERIIVACRILNISPCHHFSATLFSSS